MRLEIAKELKKHPELRVRMGIHSGPVNAVTDLNEQANIAGAGINIAQRVMDCGDAGHILLSKHVAEDLEHYPRWQPYLHDLGECEVKARCARFGRKSLHGRRGQRSGAHTSRGTEAIFCCGQTVRRFSDTAGRGGYLDRSWCPGANFHAGDPKVAAIIDQWRQGGAIVHPGEKHRGPSV